MKLRVLSPLFLQNLIWIPTRIILKFFSDFEVVGLENIQNLKPGIIFSVNHSSELDPILLPASFPFFSKFLPVFYVSRENNFYRKDNWRHHLYGGVLFKSWGAYPTYVGLRDYERSLIHHIKILNDKNSLCIFPEGRTTQDGSIGQGKGGVVFLAYKTGCPIVPVRIFGSFKSTIKSFFSGKNKITLVFGKPIWSQELLGGLMDMDKDKNSIEYEQFHNLAGIVMDKIRNISIS